MQQLVQAISLAISLTSQPSSLCQLSPSRASSALPPLPLVAASGKAACSTPGRAPIDAEG